MFHKWAKIENSYNQKNIKQWIDRYPELEDCQYIITEKLHGSNIQIIIDKYGYQIASRKRILEEGEKFYDVWNVIKKYESKINKIVEYIRDYHYVNYVNLYGELFGLGINKGVDYCKEKHIYFFGMRIDGKLLAPFHFRNYADLFKIPVVPFVDMVKGLTNALKSVDVESLVTFINPYENNISEGIVIQPFMDVFVSPVGATFILKKKAEKFVEKSRKAKKPRKQKVFSPEIQEPKDIFESYLNDNRLESVFSKEGPIDDIKDMGNYISLVMEDMKEDFLKENDISHLKKKDQKQVFSGAGSIIAKMLSEKLKGE